LNELWYKFKRTAVELYSEREQVQHYINKNYIEMREGLGNRDQSAKEVFKWNDGTIGMIPSLGNIACIFTVFLASYVMDEKGMFFLITQFCSPVFGVRE
jgi:hypothetical protein